MPFDSKRKRTWLGFRGTSMYQSLRVEFISFYFLEHRDMEKELYFFISTKRPVPYVDLCSNPPFGGYPSLREAKLHCLSHTQGKLQALRETMNIPVVERQIFVSLDNTREAAKLLSNLLFCSVSWPF